MTSSTHSGNGGGLTVTQPTFFSFIREQWFHRFFQECELLSETERWLDDEELEAKASERASYYFYLKLKERLKYELRVVSWRHDLA